MPLSFILSKQGLVDDVRTKIVENKEYYIPDLRELAEK